MRELPAGPDAVLLDFADDEHPAAAALAAATAIRRAMDAGSLDDVTDIIPSERTVLVQSERGRGIDVLGVHRALRTARSTAADSEPADPEEITIAVVYDGPDLETVGALLDIDPAEVAEIHRTTRWRVQFMGFAPGFGYLVPEDDSKHPFADIGRREESRTRVPPGAVAIAAGYSAVYPRESPGGWHLIGHTDVPLWDEQSTPPALLAPGRFVRFVDEANR
ncbi:carboxyltransferase domain-containing protein [Gordonia sp. CPCC 205515]|uniref:5-oxoprolinase subunit B family protein n=1 Tax=Gordonia sp. CPCC 205515 TaxID=3140791 RepID=UPI003AF3D6A2